MTDTGKSTSQAEGGGDGDGLKQSSKAELFSLLGDFGASKISNLFTFMILLMSQFEETGKVEYLDTMKNQILEEGDTRNGATASNAGIRCFLNFGEAISDEQCNMVINDLKVCSYVKHTSEFLLIWIPMMTGC